MREAFKRYQTRPDTVAFLDFSNENFDQTVTISPSTPNRSFWRNVYKVALDDLASLVAPQRVVICEGDREKNVRGFDAQCYNKLFAEESPETLFISRGGNKDVIHSENLIAILESIAKGIEVFRLIDRDNMTEPERDRKSHEGVRVLRRCELEEYLYDSEVLTTFMKNRGCSEDQIKEVLVCRTKLLNTQNNTPKIKDVSQKLFYEIRRISGLRNLGNRREEFALDILVPALKETPSIFSELKEDIFKPLSA